MRSSLKKAFTPSARLCRSPKGPARFGPIRFCMSPMIFRSNQIISIVAMSRNANTMTVLMTTMRTTTRSTSPANSGSAARTFTTPPGGGR
jgi:hypothetical protein